MPFNPPLRAAPADFAAIAPTLTINGAVLFWRTGADTVKRWAAELSVRLLSGPDLLEPAPANWAQLCAENSASALRKKFGWGNKIITRWSNETRIHPRDGRAQSKPNQRHNARVMRKVVRPNLSRMGSPTVIAHDNRVKSIWDDAADVLRAERWTVYRCNPRGAYFEKGKFWRVGNVVVTPEELLQRAAKYQRKAA